MKTPLLFIAVLAGLLPVTVHGQLGLRYFTCEVGAACRDGRDHGSADYSDRTLFDCADECDDDDDCNGFEWTAPDNSRDDGNCELHWDNGRDFSVGGDHENTVCCWKKKSHKSQ